MAFEYFSCSSSCQTFKCWRNILSFPANLNTRETAFHSIMICFHRSKVPLEHCKNSILFLSSINLSKVYSNDYKIYSLFSSYTPPSSPFYTLLKPQKNWFPPSSWKKKKKKKQESEKKKALQRLGWKLELFSKILNLLTPETGDRFIAKSGAEEKL